MGHVLAEFTDGTRGYLVHGTWNQTGKSDEWASRVANEEAADALVESLAEVLPDDEWDYVVRWWYEPTKTSGPSGPSGPSKTDAQRRAEGQRRVVAWLDEPTAALLDSLCESRGLTAAEVVREGIRSQALRWLGVRGVAGFR
jgi:hypothetical protein